MMPLLQQSLIFFCQTNDLQLLPKVHLMSTSKNYDVSHP